MYLNLCHPRFLSNVRFVLQLHIFLLLIQIGLNSPVKQVVNNDKTLFRQKRNQGDVTNNPSESQKRQPSYDNVILEIPKDPNTVEDNNVLPSPHLNEIDKGSPYKNSKKLEGGIGGLISKKLIDANRSSNRKLKDPTAAKAHKKLVNWKKRLPKKEKNSEYDIELIQRQHERWKKAQEEAKVQNGFAIRHISRVPQPAYPIGDEAPEGLAEDQNRHGEDDDEYEETFSTQREAFERMLDEHRKHPKRTKESQEDKYIILSYDYKNKKYSIVEIEEDEDSHSHNKHK